MHPADTLVYQILDVAFSYDGIHFEWTNDEANMIAAALDAMDNGSDDAVGDAYSLADFLGLA